MHPTERGDFFRRKRGVVAKTLTPTSGVTNWISLNVVIAPNVENESLLWHSHETM